MGVHGLSPAHSKSFYDTRIDRKDPSTFRCWLSIVFRCIPFLPAHACIAKLSGWGLSCEQYSLRYQRSGGETGLQPDEGPLPLTGTVMGLLPSTVGPSWGKHFSGQWRLQFYSQLSTHQNNFYHDFQICSLGLQLCTDHAMIYRIEAFALIWETGINLYTSDAELSYVIRGCEKFREICPFNVDHMLGIVGMSVFMEPCGDRGP